jgi:hypothetical protein
MQRENRAGRDKPQPSRTPAQMINASEPWDESAVSRTDKGILGAGQFTDQKLGEQDASITLLVRTSRQEQDLLNTLQDSNEQLQLTNQASINAQVAGWNAADNEHYSDSIRISREYVRAQLDVSRARWDIDQFRLDQARENSSPDSVETARGIIADMSRGVSVSPQLKADVMVAAESNEEIALSYLKDWSGARSLSSPMNHPGRHIFLGHTSDRVRIAAIRAGVAGTNPVQLAEVMATYPMPEISAAVRSVLLKNGFPGRAKNDGNGILFGDTYFSATDAGRRFRLSQQKPNRMPGKIGPVYED